MLPACSDDRPRSSTSCSTRCSPTRPRWLRAAHPVPSDPTCTRGFLPSLGALAGATHRAGGTERPIPTAAGARNGWRRPRASRSRSSPPGRRPGTWPAGRPTTRQRWTTVTTAAEAVPVAATSSGGIDVAAVVAAVEPSTVSIATSGQVQPGPFRQYGRGGRHRHRARRRRPRPHQRPRRGRCRDVTVTVNGEDRSADGARRHADDDIAVLQVDDPRGVVPATGAEGDPPSATRSWPSATPSPSKAG